MESNQAPDVARTFVELADTLVTGFDVVDLLHVLATRCVELLDVSGAGLLLADQTGKLRVIASSAEQARLLELFEVQNEEGPCLDCYRTGTRVLEPDLESTERWPQFAREAVAAGFRSVLAIPLRLRNDVIGALNLFGADTGRPGDNDVAIAQALADVATIGLLQERAVRQARVLAEQLQGALNNRVVIEQAKGVLAERAGVEMDKAFALLRTYARVHNLLLADVARAVIHGRLSVAELQALSP